MKSMDRHRARVQALLNTPVQGEEEIEGAVKPSGMSVTHLGQRYYVPGAYAKEYQRRVWGQGGKADADGGNSFFAQHPEWRDSAVASTGLPPGWVDPFSPSQTAASAPMMDPGLDFSSPTPARGPAPSPVVVEDDPKFYRGAAYAAYAPVPAIQPVPVFTPPPRQAAPQPQPQYAPVQQPVPAGFGMPQSSNTWIYVILGVGMLAGIALIAKGAMMGRGK